MSAAGFTLAGADHAIIPVMLGDAKLAAEMASRMLAADIYVVGFSFPVVPKGQPASAPRCPPPTPVSNWTGHRCLHSHRPRTRHHLI